MIVSADELQATSMARVLGEDDLVLTRVPDLYKALALAPATTPDVVLIDQRAADPDDSSLIRSLRMRLGRRDLPVILLTDGADGEVPTDDSLAVATDYLAKPLSLPMLRTRVRTWLVRTLTQPHVQSHEQACRARGAQS
jgi:DNA-binding response OmpR family regulator